MNRKTMEGAAAYAVAHLQAIRSDMDDPSYSRKMRNDMDLAIAMLRHAPVLYDKVGILCGFVEAGDNGDPEMQLLVRAAEKIRAAVERGTDREQASLI